MANDLMTLSQILSIIESTQQAIVPVSGDCMEDVGIMDGGKVLLDFTRRPAPPRYKSKGGDGTADFCACYAIPPGGNVPLVMIKQYTGMWGTWHMVGTRYNTQKRKRLNWGVRALHIFGVVLASWDKDGTLLWERERDSFPDSLSEDAAWGGTITPRTVQVTNIRHLILWEDRHE